MSLDVFEKMEAATREAVDELTSGKYYTDRRDAADALTESLVTAANAIKLMCNDPDVDVSKACTDNINRLRKVLDLPPRHTPVQTQAVHTDAPVEFDPEKKPTTDHMLRVVSSRSGRAGRPVQDGYEISCKTSTGRQQKVYVRTGEQDQAGDTIIQVYSVCGPAKEQMFRWALKTNRKLRLGALSVMQRRGVDTFVLMNTHLETGLDPCELEADIAYISETADWIEQQITGTDTH